MFIDVVFAAIWRMLDQEQSGPVFPGSEVLGASTTVALEDANAWLGSRKRRVLPATVRDDSAGERD